MSLLDQITQDMVASQKAGQAEKLAALRFLRSALLARAKDLRQEMLSDEEALTIIQREIKKHRDSIEAFTQGNRPELAAAEQAELDILTVYLPPQLSEQELEQMVQETITEQNLTPPYDFGRLMGAVMKKVGSRSDGTAVRQVVQRIVGS